MTVCPFGGLFVSRIMQILVVGPVLKMKTGLRDFETERNLVFRKCAEIW